MSQKIQFHTLTYKRRGDDWLVAYEPTGSYALVDEEGKQVIEHLQHKSIQQTNYAFPEYDVEEFIESLANKGLVYKKNHHVVDHKKHLTDILSIPTKKLRWVQHPITTGTIIGILLTGLFALLTQPQLIPQPEWFFATNYTSLLIPLALATLFIIHALHELGHYLVLKSSGHTTGLQLRHRWHFLRTHVNLNNAQLLEKHARTKVYAAGLATDLVIFTLATLVIAHTANPYAKLIALLSFLHALGQFIPHNKADLMRIASHKMGVQDITTHFKKVLKSACIFCKQKDEFHSHAAPLLLLSTLILATILAVYILPIVAVITVQSIQATLQPQTTQYADAMITLVLLATTLAFSTASLQADHPKKTKRWFRTLHNAVFILASFSTILLISITLTNFATTAEAFIGHIILGGLYVLMLKAYNNHYQHQEYHLPATALLTSMLLLAALATYTNTLGVAQPITSYVVVYATGFLGASVL